MTFAQAGKGSREPLHNSLRSVVKRTRAARCVVFLTNSLAIGCKRRLVAHPEPTATASPELCRESQGQRDLENRAFIRHALNADRATMCLHQLPGDVQAQAQSARAVTIGDALELFKNPLLGRL